MDQATKLRLKVGNNDISSKKLNSRVIAVTSGKGGVGKSCISVNLAIALKKMGKEVVIVDADFGLANVEVMLGMCPKYNISDIIDNDREISDIISNGPMDLSFISGGQGIDSLNNISAEKVKTLINKLTWLDEVADVIIIDTGAGISDSVLQFVMFAPEVLLVITPEPTSITDAYSLLKTINRNDDFDKNNSKINIVVNKAHSEANAEELFTKLNTVSNKFLNLNLTYMGCVFEDAKVIKGIIAQKPVSMLFPNSNVTMCYENIAKRLENYEVKNSGFAKLFFDLIKSKNK